MAIELESQATDNGHRQNVSGSAMPTDETTPLVKLETTTPKDKQIAQEEGRGILQLMGPMITSDAVAVVPMIVMSLLMGNVSTTNASTILAGSSLSSFFQGQVVNSLMGGVGQAVEMLGCQSFGAKQFAQLCIYAQAGIMTYAYCMPVLLLLSFNGRTIFQLMGQNATIAHVASVLMRIDALSIPLIFAASMSRCVLVSQRRVAPLAFVPIVSNAISLPLAYFLGYYTSLGYIGIEIASVINNLVSAVVYVWMTWQSPVVQGAWPGWQWREAHDLIKRMRPIIIAGYFMSIFQSLGLNMISIICGYLPNAAQSMASSSIVDSMFSLVVIPLVGTYSGGRIVVGNALGANKPRHAAIGSVVSITLTVLVGLLTVLIGMPLAPAYAQTSTSDATTAATATSLYFSVILLAVPLTGWMFGMQGVLCACGRQWIAALFSFAFVCLVGSPLGYLFGVTWGLGTAGVWYGVLLGILTNNLVTSGYLWRLDWTRVAQEAFENTHIHAHKTAYV